MLNPECTVNVLSDDGTNIKFIESEIDKLFKYDCIAFGMGVGVTEENYQIIKYLLENYDKKLLIDADGLNVLSKFGTEVLKNKKCKVILTPHIGEFSRLAKIDKTEVLYNPVQLAVEFAKEFDVTVVLKSATTIIADNEQVYINTSGCSGLAKAGSGDLLSGIICGLLARSDDVVETVAVGCHLFGKAGEFAQKEQNEWTVTAMNVVNKIPEVINFYRKNQ